MISFAWIVKTPSLFKVIFIVAEGNRKNKEKTKKNQKKNSKPIFKAAASPKTGKTKLGQMPENRKERTGKNRKEKPHRSFGAVF